MGMNHLRVLRAAEGIEVVSVCDSLPERRAAAERTHPGLTTQATLGAALAAHELDFACVAVPVEALPEITLQALAAGLHVLVEKPTAPDEQQAATIIDDAARRGLLLSVGHVERCNPAVLALREKVAEGVIGRIVQMHARRLSPFPNRGGAQGVALDLATHDIDVMRFVSGDEVGRVYAETASPLGDGREDLLCGSLRFDSGATGLLEANWMSPAKVRQLTVLGERGLLVVDYLTQDLSMYQHPTKATDRDAHAGIRGGGEGDMVRFALDRREPLRVEWEQFAAAIRAGGSAPVPGEDGLAALSVARAIRASGERHEVVVPTYREMLARAVAR